jgi:hypothetical protein
MRETALDERTARCRARCEYRVFPDGIIRVNTLPSVSQCHETIGRVVHRQGSVFNGSWSAGA